MIRVTLLILFVSLSFRACHGQEISYTKTFPKTQYLEDLDSLTNKLVNIHPSPFEFTSKKDFWAIVNEKKAQVSSQTTFGEFIWMCSEIVAHLNCSHTSLGWFNQERAALPTSLMFPAEGKFIEGRLYITDPLINDDVLSKGQEVFSINGVDINLIRKEVYKHINSQGTNETYKRLLLNGYFTVYIPYALGFPESYEVLVKGKLSPIKLKPISAYRPKPRVDPDNECQRNLCFRVLDQSNTAILTVRSFAYYGDKFSVYRDFIDQSFTDIKERGVKNLILDVRMNDGDPSYAGMHLLKYLYRDSFKYWSHTAFEDEPVDTYQPFDNNFSGKLFVLMDGDCGSTTPHFLSHVKQNNLGTLIGEEANGNHLTFGGQEWFQLPNTEIKYCVGKNRYVSAANDFPKEIGILPDHHIVQGIEDYLKKVDSVMEYALGLVEK